MKQKFEVNGMMCAACQANVERAVAHLNGVSSVNVSLLGKNMVVEYDDAVVSSQEIIKAVDDSGYSCSIFVNQSIKDIQRKRAEEVRKKRNRLILSIILLLCLMVFSMGPMIPPVMDAIDRSGYMGIICIINVAMQILFLIPIVVLNWHHFSSGFKSLWKRHPNMDALVALGSSVSIVYGLYAFVRMIICFASGDEMGVMNYSMNIYFESAAMIPTFISIGKFIESQATSKTTASIAAMMALTPDTAYLCVNDEVKEVPCEALKEGDIVLVKPGASVPCDGKIVEGETSLDESMITGESIPVYKRKGDSVIGATINKEGSFKFVVEKVGKDTTIAKIIALVEEASESKAPLARLADRISGVFVPAVIGISLLVFTLWMILSGVGLVGVNHPDVNLAFQLAVSVLVISCPCALGLATPVAIMVGTGKGAENGILIKSAEAFERLEQIDVFLFDKTGTLTKGEMEVKRVIAYQGSEDDVLNLVAPYEAHSEHPLSKAIVKRYEMKGEKVRLSEAFEYIPGKGIKGDDVIVGNVALLEQEGIETSETKDQFEELSKQGLTTLFVVKNKSIIGLIGIGDAVKENSQKTVKSLQNAGKKVVMLTGDHHSTAQAIANELGIKDVYAEVLPEEKESIVAKLQEQGYKVAFVGDGINDAPALMKADVGIAIGAGTEIAIESSDIILVKNDPLDVYSGFMLSKKVVRNIKENLTWAFLYNLILIPLAAGALYAVQVSPNWLTGNQGHLVLTPMIGSIAMSLSSITVVLNALRLRWFHKEKGE